MRILNYDPMNARVGIMLVDVIEGEGERRDTKKREVEGRKERGDLVFSSLKFHHPGGVSTPPKDIYITQFSNRFRDGK